MPPILLAKFKKKKKNPIIINNYFDTTFIYLCEVILNHPVNLSRTNLLLFIQQKEEEKSKIMYEQLLVIKVKESCTQKRLVPDIQGKMSKLVYLKLK